MLHGNLAATMPISKSTITKIRMAIVIYWYINCFN